MSRALQAADRPMLFSMCDWGLSQPWLYASEVCALYSSQLSSRQEHIL